MPTQRKASEGVQYLNALVKAYARRDLRKVTPFTTRMSIWQFRCKKARYHVVNLCEVRYY